MSSVTEQITDAITADDMLELDRLLTVLDDEPNPAVLLLPSALWYASVGLPVFTLQPASKIPYPGSRGLHDATTDETLIREAWARNPSSNIAIATGHLVDVIDVDGQAGVKSWSTLIGDGALPPVLGVVSTPRPGGNHLYVAATGQGNKAGLLPGVDYRGRGGYVVAPPSCNDAGTTYRWHRPLDLAGVG